jgi:cobyrinic acid a,c-diamide synthase
MKRSAFVIAAPYSGSGKTTITIGLLRALYRRGDNPKPFKCGPDYLDPFHHEVAAKRYSYNLDAYMASEDHVKYIFKREMQQEGVAVVEGAMGMFDGAKRSVGSAAHIAKTLNIPVVLVIDARAMAYSAAPLLYGFKHFDPEINIAGVIFNFVKTESHYSFLKDAAADVGIESLGYIPPNDSVKIESRYLGLKVDEKDQYEAIVSEAADHIEKCIDIDKLIDITSVGYTETESKGSGKGSLNISIASDDAFNFFYRENINRLKELGNVTFFSPISDKEIPDNTDILYLAGGYPEFYLKQLSENKAMLQSIKQFGNSGGKILAECGGMMYLGSSITDANGEPYQMVDLFDYKTSMENRKLTLGYRDISIGNFNIRGHEFHYSQYAYEGTADIAGNACNASGKEVKTKVFRKENAIASYFHLYWGEKSIDDLF